ncbi:MAG: MBL fold metallo-hydrolase [Blastocatellia bacterium]|nr:MBL fold metallo-hydrolase [Blastocatellia bacterium]
MRFNILGSGSTGNATLVVSGETRILVDCGLTAKELAKRLSSINESIENISAILITHEHTDHIRGLATLAKNLNIAICISPTTLASAKVFKRDRPEIDIAEKVQPGQPFEIDHVKIVPVRTPHDAVDPVLFRIESRGVKIAIVTDLGHIPSHVAYELRSCDALILEANHDVELLKSSPYPWSLKQRVMSRQGHLSNEEMARFLREDYDGSARHIVLAHLSRENNHPEIATLAAQQALSARTPLFAAIEQEKIKVAHHDRPLGWIEL